MNIALFSDSYLPTKSGVVTVVMQLKRALEHAGHHVVLVTVTTKTELSPEEPYILPSTPSAVIPNAVLNSFPSPVTDAVQEKAVASSILDKSEILGGVLTCKKIRRLVFAHSPSMRHLRLCGGRA